MTHFLNPDGSFMTEDQIVDHLLMETWDEETKKVLLAGFAPKANTFVEKFIAGMMKEQFLALVRNSYGLWMPNNPYVELNPLPNSNGVIDHPLFPDNMSLRILDAFLYKFKRRFGTVNFELSEF